MADGSPSGVGKRTRKCNFTNQEVEVLVKLVNRHSKYIFGRTPLGVSTTKKRKAWDEVLRGVNALGIEHRTLSEIKNKWKKCKREMRGKRFDSMILYAEQQSNREAQQKFKISESNVRRWRKLKSEIFAEPIIKDTRYTARLMRHFKLEPDYSFLNGFQNIDDALLLQQRLPQPTTPQLQIPMVSESLLQSQPLSPTKLKVTRQLPQTSTPKTSEAAPREETPEEVCLRWNSHHFNMQTSFPNLLQKEQYVDVTLAAEGKTLKCHRLILSSCSAYFEEILNGITPSQHPVIFMKDIPFWILKSLCDFMYAGEVHIDQNKLEEMLHVAEALKIKGLGGKTNPPPPPAAEKPEQQVNVRMVQEQQPQTNVSAQSSTSIEQTTVDPLDLLQTSYLEESSTSKQKDTKFILRKTPLKKLRKRRSSQHEMSPPPLFHLRKGTRSRPNVKIPKYYHSEYEEKTKKQEESSTELTPLVQTVIKTEPIDVVDDINYPSDSLENPQNPPVISGCPLIITPIENTLQINETEAPGDGNFVKITLSSKYIKENEELIRQQTETNANTEEVPSEQPKESGNNENTEQSTAVSAPNKDPQIRVAPRKRRGRKRKFRRGKTTADAESKSTPKKALIETDTLPVTTDELSESLKRLESTEGLEVTAEVVEFEAPPQCNVGGDESERINENGVPQITPSTNEDELKAPSIQEQLDETTTTIEEAPDEPTQLSIEEDESKVEQQQQDTFTVITTAVTNAESPPQLPTDTITTPTTDLDESDVTLN